MPKAKKARSTPKQDETMYALDVAFASDTTASDSSKPITMAYGFAHSDDGDHWVGDGQTPETLSVGNDVYFSIFDTGPTAEGLPSLREILITFSPKGSPFEWFSLLFSDSALPLPPVRGTDMSAGCNVEGRFWRVGPYPATNGSKEGGYECTVQVRMRMADGKTKTFRVDPEMIIKGG